MLGIGRMIVGGHQFSNDGRLLLDGFSLRSINTGIKRKQQISSTQFRARIINLIFFLQKNCYI